MNVPSQVAPVQRAIACCSRVDRDDQDRSPEPAYAGGNGIMASDAVAPASLFSMDWLRNFPTYGSRIINM
jgi:hypothetical protein